MNKITLFTDTMTKEISVIIDRGNNEFTSMLKSTYDEQQAQLTQLTTEGA